MTTEVELMQIKYTCDGMGHILLAMDLQSMEEPAIRQELANLMRLTADMVELQKFDMDLAVRARAFAMTMRDLEARP